jgi:hypothetical protein
VDGVARAYLSDGRTHARWDHTGLTRRERVPAGRLSVPRPGPARVARGDHDLFRKRARRELLRIRRQPTAVATSSPTWNAPMSTSTGTWRPGSPIASTLSEACRPRLSRERLRGHKPSVRRRSCSSRRATSRTVRGTGSLTTKKDAAALPNPHVGDAAAATNAGRPYGRGVQARRPDREEEVRHEQQAEPVGAEKLVRCSDLGFRAGVQSLLAHRFVAAFRREKVTCCRLAVPR